MVSLKYFGFVILILFKISSAEIVTNLNEIYNHKHVEKVDPPLAPSFPLKTGNDPLKPGSDPLKPGNDPLRPGNDSQKPGSDPLKPGSDPQKPGSDPLKPGTDPQKPGTDPQKPGTDPQKPGTDPQKPGTDPQKPGTDPQKPGTDPQKPGTDPQKPGTDPQKPGTDPQKPGTDPQKPVISDKEVNYNGTADKVTWNIGYPSTRDVELIKGEGKKSEDTEQNFEVKIKYPAKPPGEPVSYIKLVVDGVKKSQTKVSLEKGATGTNEVTVILTVKKAKKFSYVATFYKSDLRVTHFSKGDLTSKDKILAYSRKSENSDKPEDYKADIKYPAKGGSGKIVTGVSVLMEVPNDTPEIPRASITKGDIGAKEMTVHLEAKKTKEFIYTIIFYTQPALEKKFTFGTKIDKDGILEQSSKLVKNEEAKDTKVEIKYPVDKKKALKVNYIELSIIVPPLDPANFKDIKANITNGAIGTDNLVLTFEVPNVKEFEYKVQLNSANKMQSFLYAGAVVFVFYLSKKLMQL